MRAAIIVASLGAPLLLSPLSPHGSSATDPGLADTLRLEVGSKQIDGRVYQPHAARVRVRIGDAAAPVVAEWTNQLTLGDSAGRQVMRWVTKGKRTPPNGAAPITWELRQTYDARTLAPLGYHSTSSVGTRTQLRIEGRSVKGEKRTPADSVAQPVDITLDRPGFFAGASDLVPAAVGLKAGSIMTAPFWSPAMEKAETRVFTVVGTSKVDVEGSSIEAWKVLEHQPDGQLLATWYLLDKSPYMVYGEVPLPDGRTQVMTEVEIPAPD